MCRTVRDLLSELFGVIVESSVGKLPETTAVHHTGKKGPITLTTCGLRTGDCGDGLVLAVSAALVHRLVSCSGHFSWQMRRWYYTCFRHTCVRSTLWRGFHIITDKPGDLKNSLQQVDFLLGQVHSPDSSLLSFMGKYNLKSSMHE